MVKRLLGHLSYELLIIATSMSVIFISAFNEVWKNIFWNIYNEKNTIYIIRIYLNEVFKQTVFNCSVKLYTNPRTPI